MTDEFQRVRKPGSVRLTDEQYEEMEQLGLPNESAYVNYKLNHARNHLQVIKHGNSEGELATGNPMSHKPSLEDKLALQRLTLENQQLKEKLDVLGQDKEEALNGVHHQVNHLLKEELLKRDFESLKKENANQQKEIEKLEKQLEKAEEVNEDKNKEIEEMVKKLGLVELGKTLLPGAVDGLARRYPKEMQGLAATLGGLSGHEAGQLPPATLNNEQQSLLEIAEYLQGLFSDEQFEQVIQMISQLAEHLKEDDTMISKVIYYLNQMGKIRKSKQRQSQSGEAKEEQEQT